MRTTKRITVHKILVAIESKSIKNSVVLTPFFFSLSPFFLFFFFFFFFCKDEKGKAKHSSKQMPRH